MYNILYLYVYAQCTYYCACKLDGNISYVCKISINIFAEMIHKILPDAGILFLHINTNEVNKLSNTSKYSLSYSCRKISGLDAIGGVKL